MFRYGFVCLAALALAVSAAAQYPGSAPPPAQWKKGYDSITPADSHKYLSYLAGPETMGRGTGQPGYQKAAEYMAARFKEFGLKPVGDNGTYFQGMPFWRSYFEDRGSSLKLVASGATFLGGRDFRMTSITKSLDTTAVIVEVTATGDQLDVDPSMLAKRIVLVRGERPSLRFRSRVNAANPAAVLYVSESLPMIEYAVSRREPTTPRIPVGNITTKAANELARQARMTQLNVAGGGALKFSAGNARLVANAVSGTVSVPNVVGMFEGSDPTLKAEVVGLGCHLDHLGVSNGQVYWGADDDGSGSAALIQVAKAFATNPVKPKRSIVFMAFAAEEMGLIGSAHYVANPAVPNEKMIAELQMDMVGRNSVGAQNGDNNRIDIEAENVDTIRLVGSKRISMDLHDLIMDMNKYVNFKFKYDAEDVYTRSDHYNFARVGIPVAFLFSGFHPDYHRPTDTIDKINFDKIANTAKLFYLTASALADRTTPLRKIEGK